MSDALDKAHDRARYAFEADNQLFLAPQIAMRDAGMSDGFEAGWNAAVKANADVAAEVLLLWDFQSNRGISFVPDDLVSALRAVLAGEKLANLPGWKEIEEEDTTQ